MPYQKGQSGNVNGKPKGAKNKLGLELREMIGDFLAENFEKIKEDFHSLTPRERSKLYCDLLQYGLPRLQAINLDMEFEDMTEEQLDEIIERLKQSAKQ